MGATISLIVLSVISVFKVSELLVVVLFYWVPLVVLFKRIVGSAKTSSTAFLVAVLMTKSVS